MAEETPEQSTTKPIPEVEAIVEAAELKRTRNEPAVIVTRSPTVGRIVMYRDAFKHGDVYPAVVARDPELTYPYLDLVVLDINQNPPAVAVKGVAFKESEWMTPGTWHWPEIK